MSELRRDPLRGHWSIIASERGRRPNDFRRTAQIEADPKRCPFCAGNESETPAEILAHRANASAANGPGWAIRVFPNRYPAVRPDLRRGESLKSSPLFERQDGVGHHEIVVVTPEHDRHWSELSVDHWDRVWVTCQHRMQDLWRTPSVKHVTLFINHGAAAGASRAHPHLQIAALPVVPQAHENMLARTKGHYSGSQTCLCCDVLALELEDASRVVAEDLAYVSYAPFASRGPFECAVVPRAHRASFLHVPSGERRRFSLHLRELFQRLQSVVPDAPWNLVLHSAPPGEHDHRVPFHWFVELLPRLSEHAGLEVGSGTYLNTVPPEDAAARLRRIDVHA